ncbi:UDP-3-O-[3-hydroxymyristoyl] N-acetylglucosamine deacetylase [candidate division WOR-1 bacterium RIFOXYA12_FULL_43_27]|uniref:UDP-3-O-acyl-N-acetylglucosamine deacetylase n=1 Tax=candidate division WOR-1 bacterium RIFOXYC2_FULL_46_14 TaxID=1802587 RepID=A0A1F4U4T8_UNCSA|nr:MAG: UDP-3-O-[3-hydroxymyristoyl] N-acetylglucosamine deacetylase [candidate division WOR-1 bacterium RIFOXYA12_FULL_43_27]OGC20783.1 MAG: UDP-3-O-[3-hydroxymyristoyl] N-acetylglucosamine deacetylase [candidate division WOR-1 bacterium RIFOXYB2_FULL_46_45]OGC31480.1 MAG: UDP-3-O-[3-hydroxymyristoyl] N-acetylglucosamine deacetylase [candidate division WOR-1 bacterium RIFOXYA2_FULL_46_56]OGC39887.1 MAG: UDP-3-O-[3-hydroxymyristoyl] N-acetylglucosamine deacetylase [candidate division WOR-1 bacte
MITLSGVGIHSGKKSTVKILPQPAGFGIKFSLGDEIFPVDITLVTGSALATTLGKITQVEHLLAAARGMRVTDILVKCESNEIPILDGSSLPYVLAFEKAGLAGKDKSSPLILKETVRIEEGGKLIVAEPAENFSIEFSVDYPVIGKQSFYYDGSVESFKKEIAPARTFGYEKDLESLHQNGLALGASLDNALGIDEKGYMNPPRFENEPVRHKILDLIGDLALLGRPINAKIKAYKSSHRLNQLLVRRIINA